MITVQKLAQAIAKRLGGTEALEEVPVEPGVPNIG